MGLGAREGRSSHDRGTDGDRDRFQHKESPIRDLGQIPAGFKFNLYPKIKPSPSAVSPVREAEYGRIKKTGPPGILSPLVANQPVPTLRLFHPLSTPLEHTA